MDLIKMRHPQVAQPVRVQLEAVGAHALAGWVIDDTEDPPRHCPTCGSPWPAPPPQAEESSQALADAGAVSSTTSSPAQRRRRSSKESG